MLEKVKTALRISNSAFDEEIEDLIEGAQMDLVQAGVSSEKAADEEDPLIRRALIIYCKANFGMDSPDADRFAASYESLKHHLSMAGDYNGNSLE